MTLHTVNKSPFASNCLAQCLNVANGNHIIILLEDGIYGALAQSPLTQALDEFCSAGGKVYAVISDIEARGLKGQIKPSVSQIDYADFVDLCVQHNPIQSWY
jgi:tRNA 2-thiouridine synthesizing protein B